MTPASAPLPSENDCRLFWSWLGEMRFELEEVRPENPGFVETLASRMKVLHPSLGCEVSFGASGARTLRLTCQADIAAAPIVDRLFSLAPPMRGWTVARFRPRVPGIGHITVDGATIGPDEVEFAILRGAASEGMAGRLAVVLFVRGLDPSGLAEGSVNPPEAQCALFLLEHLLGEEDLMRGVDAVRILPWEAVTDLPRTSLREVAAAFDDARAAP